MEEREYEDLVGYASLMPAISFLGCAGFEIAKSFHAQFKTYQARKAFKAWKQSQEARLNEGFYQRVRDAFNKLCP